jgi:hypothetical protein
MTFTCAICGDEFKRKGMLEKHCCVYPCKFCPAVFPRKWNRDTHEKTCKVKMAMGADDIKHVLLEVQQRLRNLEKKHNTVVTRHTKDIQRLQSRCTGLWDKINQQAWQITELMNARRPPPAPRVSLLDRVDKRLQVGKFTPERKTVWERVDTDLNSYPFTG